MANEAIRDFPFSTGYGSVLSKAMLECPITKRNKKGFGVIAGTLLILVIA